MAKRLTANVTVGSTTYAIGDEVPAEHADLIDAPDVFEGDDEADAPKPAPRGRAKSE